MGTPGFPRHIKPGATRRFRTVYMKVPAETLKKQFPNQASGSQPVIPGGLQHDGVFEPASSRAKTTGPNSEADPESTLAWASVPENSCVKSFAGMDSGSACMAGTLNSHDTRQLEVCRNSPGRPE